MNDLTKTLALALCLSFGTAALAQETTPEAPATETPAPDAPATEAPAAGTTAPTGMSMGTEVADPNAPGSVYTAATHGDWEQRCIKAEDGSDPCTLYQLLKDEQGNAVAEITMIPLPEGTEAVAGATIIAPLETLLTEGLRLQVDASKGKAYPFTWCAPEGCAARVGFTAAEIDSFKNGDKATITIVPVVAPDQKVLVNISLKGFTAGYDAVKASRTK